MTDEYKVLRELNMFRNFSLRDIAARLGWIDGEGLPDKIGVHRALVNLAERGLVTHSGSYKGWRVTGRGSEVVNRINNLEE